MLRKDTYNQEAAENNKADPGPRGVGEGGQAQIGGWKIKYIGCKKSYQPLWLSNDIFGHLIPH